MPGVQHATRLPRAVAAADARLLRPAARLRRQVVQPQALQLRDGRQRGRAAGNGARRSSEAQLRAREGRLGGPSHLRKRSVSAARLHAHSDRRAAAGVAASRVHP
jgi:hypothetical protein